MPKLLNTKLSQLKSIFDRIEFYSPEMNIGLRSLKNIGVWLSVYALTEEKEHVLAELATAARLNFSEEDLLKSIVDDLISTDNLSAVIRDYEKANGTFEISVQTESQYELFVEKIKACGLENCLLSHVKLNPVQSSVFAFSMNNMVKFKWCADDSIEELEKVNDVFQGRKIDYLQTSTAKYYLINYQDHLFHLVDFPTQEIIAGKKYNNNAFLIEAADSRDNWMLQKEYFNILETFKNDRNPFLTSYNLLLRHKDLRHAVHFSGKYQIGGEYNCRVRFPLLMGTLATKEERLGIYAYFGGKTIGHIVAEEIGYLGVRKLTYDEKGGEVENKEEFDGRESYMVPVVPPTILNINYTTHNSYMMVYDSGNGNDFYPFFIADPTQNLSIHFDAHAHYEEQDLDQATLSGHNDMDVTETPCFDPRAIPSKPKSVFSKISAGFHSLFEKTSDDKNSCTNLCYKKPTP